MKKRFFVGTIFSVAMAGICASAEATTRPSVMILKEPPHRVYHVVKEQGLRAAAQQIAERSGIKFKISADIGSDQVSKKLAADNWDEALFQFLAGYNYTLTTEKGSIKSVIITGKNGSGSQNKAKQELESQMLAVVPGQQSLPAVYSQLAPGSVMPIALSMSKIAAVKLGSKVVLDLPVGQYTINHDEKVDDGNGAMTWMGYLDDEGKGYRLYLSQGEAGIMGNLNTPDGSYQIETVDGQTYLVDEVRSGMSLGGYHNDEALLSAMPAFNVVEPELRTAAARVSSGASGEPIARTGVTARAVATPIVDVMVLYTKVKQTQPYAIQRAKYLVNVANLAYRDSFINMRLRLVHTRATNYVEKGSNNSALSALANNTGAFAGTSALRNQYGADLVLLLRPFYASTSGGCGVAYVGFSSGGGASASTGFGVISDGKSRDAPTNHYCGIGSFAHEVGHTLGNVHDRQFASFSGKFSYSYAWGINNVFGTVMSYHGPSLMLFATPQLPTQCAGRPCGYAQGAVNASDQTRTINYTAPFVSGYKPKTIITPVFQ